MLIYFEYSLTSLSRKDFGVFSITFVMSVIGDTILRGYIWFEYCLKKMGANDFLGVGIRQPLTSTGPGLAPGGVCR